MKKILAGILTVFITLGCFPLAALAEETILLAGQNANAAIVTADDPSGRLAFAAQTLQQYLAEITGQTLPIGSASDAEKMIILQNDPSLAEGAYRIAAKDGGLVIAGGGNRGAIYGVFGFLEDACGCRFYTNAAFLIPQAEEVIVSERYSLSYTPYFEYTDTDWRNGENPVFTVANGVCSGTHCSIPEAMGGCIRYVSGFAHTLTNQFCSAAVYFESHPEYFALRDGVRTPNQLCLTNPDTVRIVKDEVLSLLRQTHDPAQALQIVSVTQHDNGDYCTCPTCAALDEANGSHAGTMVAFANEIAEAVADAGYDNVAVDTFAYQYTRRPPTRVVPRDNVIIRLCSIECCFGHTLDDPDCEENVKFMKDLKDWAKICDRIYVWDYGTNYSEYINFFPNFHVLQRNMQLFYENNVKGVYGEGNYQTALCNGEFCDLRLYLQAKLMQDPYLDFDSEMNGFLQFYYGNGWQSIRDFIDLCCEKGVTKKKHAQIFDRAKGSLPGISARDISRCDALWEAAAQGAETTEQQEHVRRSAFCWRYWKCANSKGEFSVFHTPYQRMKARDELYLDLVEAGTAILGETTRKRALSDCYALHLMRIPFCWTTLYDDAFWDAVSPAVVTVYQWLGKLHSDR